jgi:hypothetical protein
MLSVEVFVKVVDPDPAVVIEKLTAPASVNVSGIEPPPFQLNVKEPGPDPTFT